MTDKSIKALVARIQEIRNEVREGRPVMAEIGAPTAHERGCFNGALHDLDGAMAELGEVISYRRHTARKGGQS